MSALADLRPGDVMFCRHVRPRAADLLILAGQLTLGQPGYPHHVAVVTQAGEIEYSHGYGEGKFVNPKIMQAMPSGAEEIEIGAEHWTDGYVYVRPAYEAGWVHRVPGFAGSQAEAVAAAAREYIGTPYSFVDYAAIAAHHLSGEGYAPIEERNRLQRYVASSKRMICSQLVDQSLSDAGFRVYDDGRLPQDITPAALFTQLATMHGSMLIKPTA
jgi:hypothetical protein